MVKIFDSCRHLLLSTPILCSDSAGTPKGGRENFILGCRDESCTNNSLEKLTVKYYNANLYPRQVCEFCLPTFRER